jgi:hypothetical protein
MKGHPIRYSAEEMAWLAANRLMVISDYADAFEKRFGRRIDAKNLHALRKRKGWKTGRTGCFEKGAEPHNKGKPCPEGTGGRHPNARRTQFKKGNLPHNTHYVGHERVDPKDGYVYVSVNETNPHTGFERRYVLKHKWLWEQKNGKLPGDHALKCRDGNRQNCDPENWEPVPRSCLPRLAGGNRYRRVVAYDDAAPELRPTILTIAKLERAAKGRAA